MKISTEAVYNCTPEQYWQHFFDEESRRRQEVEGCGSQVFRVLEKSTREGKLFQRAEAVDRTDAPAAVRKLLGETTRVVEEALWEPGSNVVHLTYTPERMTNRIRMAGTQRTEALGDGRCRVIADFEVEVQIFGIGGMVERLLAKELPARHRKAAAHFNQRGQ
jgi:hypothetical protein